MSKCVKGFDTLPVIDALEAKFKADYEYALQLPHDGDGGPWGINDQAEMTDWELAWCDYHTYIPQSLDHSARKEYYEELNRPNNVHRLVARWKTWDGGL